jgi:hypothetical protein
MPDPADPLLTHALTAPEGNPVHESYLVKHAAPVWLGGVWGAFPKLIGRQDGTRGTWVPWRRCHG